MNNEAKLEDIRNEITTYFKDNYCKKNYVILSRLSTKSKKRILNTKKTKKKIKILIILYIYYK